MPKAFTLIEVLIAGAILIIGAVALLSAWSTVQATTDFQKKSVEATSLTRRFADRVLLVAPEDLPTAPITQVNAFGEAGSGPFTVAYAITDTPMGSIVRVTTSWNGNDGRAHSISVPVVRAD
jgi:type II secretory pathway pseudopilin PulG